MRSVDDLDLEIAGILDSDGRASNREIARRLGISETTVRHRLGRMINNGMLNVNAQFDIEEFSDIYMAIIWIKLSASPDRCAEEIRKNPSVLYVLTVTGRYDLQVAVLVNSHKMLARFVSWEIRNIEGVAETETFIVLENFGLQVSAAKLNTLMKYQLSPENDSFEENSDEK